MTVAELMAWNPLEKSTIKHEDAKGRKRGGLTIFLTRFWLTFCFHKVLLV